MTETPPAQSQPVVDIAHPSHNPFDVPRPRRNNGVTAAIVLSMAVHALIGYYLWQWKFKSHYQSYADEKWIREDEKKKE